METFELRCINCGEFHEYGQLQCYDQGWANQPRASWQGEEDFNPWIPPIHQYYGEYEHQPYDQEQGPRKKNLEDIVEIFVNQSQTNFMNQAASIRNLWSQVGQLAKQLAEKERKKIREKIYEEEIEKIREEIMKEEEGDSELSEENVFPQTLEEEEEEPPKEVSTEDHEPESYNTLGDQEETMVEYEEVEEVSLVDFIFGDKLQRNDEKPLSLSIYLRNLWSKGAHGKEQTRGGAIISRSWKQSSEIFLKSLPRNLLFAAMISEYACNVMMLLCKNLHDLSGLSQFAIDPG